MYKMLIRNLQAELGTRKIYIYFVTIEICKQNWAREKYIFTLWFEICKQSWARDKNIYLLCDKLQYMRPQAVREATACQAKTTVWQQYDNNLKYFPFIVYLQKDCQTQKQKF